MNKSSLVSPINILIGADPELFVIDQIEGKYISAHDLIPGTKASPFFVDKGAVQPDGVAAEFNIFPAADANEFLTNINTVRGIMRKMIRQHVSYGELVGQPTVLFDEEYFKNLPTKAKALGCSPDFNAWEGKMNPPPRTKKPMRTGAGHIHIGGWAGEISDPSSKAHMAACQGLVKQLDIVMYPMSLVWDKDRTRQELYGRMGCFRPKYYGVEYRPLSNAWLDLGPEMIMWVFNIAKKATELYVAGTKIYEEYEFGIDDPILSAGDEALMNFYFQLEEEYDLPECPTWNFSNLSIGGLYESED